MQQLFTLFAQQLLFFGTLRRVGKKAVVERDELRRLRGDIERKRRLELMVSDLTVQQAELDQVKRILAEEMQGAAELSVPLEIDMKQGTDWYEAH